jgi:hypothetical protein
MSHQEGLQHSYGPEHVADQSTAPEVYHPPPDLEHNPYGQQSQAATSGYGYAAKPAGADDEKEAVTGGAGAKKRILGLPVMAFWAVIIGIAVVLGVALGAGLGIGLKHNDTVPAAATTTTTTSANATAVPESTKPPTTTKPSTSTTTKDLPSPTTSYVTSGTSGLAANSCNSTDPKNYFAPDGTQFTEYCFTDWPDGAAAADGQGKVQDLDAVTVYTFEDCIQNCLDYNQGLAANETQCRAVTYNSNLTSIIEVGQQGGDCFLKNKNGASHGTGSIFSACAVMAD